MLFFASPFRPSPNLSSSLRRFFCSFSFIASIAPRSTFSRASPAGAKALYSASSCTSAGTVFTFSGSIASATSGISDISASASASLCTASCAACHLENVLWRERADSCPNDASAARSLASTSLKSCECHVTPSTLLLLSAASIFSCTALSMLSICSSNRSSLSWRDSSSAALSYRRSCRMLSLASDQERVGSVTVSASRAL
mmetsp:Transcript_12468/g.29464  ORF Transcript_12468/g.29464 Transcript_12468/m.29464 type:complete len:201 (-) Transcript_12468:67-669(-)